MHSWWRDGADPGGSANADVSAQGLAFQRPEVHRRLGVAVHPALGPGFARFGSRPSSHLVDQSGRSFPAPPAVLGPAGPAGHARHRGTGSVARSSRSAGLGVRLALVRTGSAAAAAVAHTGLGVHRTGSVEVFGRSPCRPGPGCGIVLGRRIETYFVLMLVAVERMLQADEDVCAS